MINKDIDYHSHDNSEDIIVTVESSLTVGTNVEHLRKLEVLGFVHCKRSWHKDQETSLNWSRLNVLVVNVVIDLLEAERFDFLWDLLDSSKGLSTVSHDAVVIVEVNELSSVLHNSCVVLSEELLGDVFEFRHCNLPPKII